MKKKPRARYLQAMLLSFLRVRAPKTSGGDRLFSFFQFLCCHGRLPRSTGLLFNDYLYHLKNSSEIDCPLRALVTDKYSLKKYVEKKLGHEWNVPTISLIDKASEIHQFSFPRQCVIKPTHLYNQIIIRTDFGHVDLSRVRSWFLMDHYQRTRERNYRRLQRRVIVEPILFENPNLMDYKFLCFRGVPAIIDVITDRWSGMRTACYSTNWEALPFAIDTPESKRIDVPKPRNLEKMLYAARVLSADFSFMRVDMYSNGSDVCIGELTSVPGSATLKINPASAETMFSSLLFGDGFSRLSRVDVRSLPLGVNKDYD